MKNREHFNRNLLASRLLLPLIVFLLALILTDLLVIPSTPTFACSTVQPSGEPTATPVTISAKVQAAEVVVEGIATNVLWSPFVQATLKIKRYFKGSGPATVILSGFSPPGACRYVPIDQRKIFYTNRSSTGGLSARFFSIDDATDNNDDTTISQIISSAGQNPILPVEGSPSPDLTISPTIQTPVVQSMPELTKSLPQETNENESVLYLVIAILAILIGTTCFFFWRRKNVSR
jgi:hypothetical protein